MTQVGGVDSGANSGGRTIRNTVTNDSRQEEQTMKPVQETSVKTVDGTSQKESAITTEREESSTNSSTAKDDPHDMNPTVNKQQQHDVPYPEHYGNDNYDNDEEHEQQQGTKDVVDTTLSAIRRGDLDALKKRLEETTTTNAARHEFFDKRHNHAVDDEDLDSFTLLHLAVKVGDLPIVQYLVEEQGLDIETVECHGLTSLHLAVKHGSLPVVEYLLRAGANLEAIDHPNGLPCIMPREREI
jgi:hypothetical protein